MLYVVYGKLLDPMVIMIFLIMRKFFDFIFFPSLSPWDENAHNCLIIAGNGYLKKTSEEREILVLNKLQHEMDKTVLAKKIYGIIF